MVAHEGALQDVIEKHQEQEGEGTTSGKPTPGSGKKEGKGKGKKLQLGKSKEAKKPSDTQLLLQWYSKFTLCNVRLAEWKEPKIPCKMHCLQFIVEIKPILK